MAVPKDVQDAYEKGRADGVQAAKEVLEAVLVEIAECRRILRGEKVD